MNDRVTESFHKLSADAKKSYIGFQIRKAKNEGNNIQQNYFFNQPNVFAFIFYLNIFWMLLSQYDLILSKASSGPFIIIPRLFVSANQRSVCGVI